jgi:acyl carrier protein
MNDTITAIKAILGKLKRDESMAAQLSDEADLIDEVGLDSLEMLQFMLEVEERLGLQIDFEALEFDYLRSIRVLAEFLDRTPRKETESTPDIT